MLRRYVMSRVLAGIFGLMVFLTATFFMAKLLVPGDITSNFRVGFGGNLDNIREALGLDRASVEAVPHLAGWDLELQPRTQPGRPVGVEPGPRCLAMDVGDVRAGSWGCVRRRLAG